MKVAIIGVGGLGSALAHGLVSRRGHELLLCDRHAEKLAPFAKAASIVASPGDAAAEADVILVTVKPHATVAVCADAAARMRPGALLISCAAGIATRSLPQTVALARAMPSVGAAAGASTTGVFLAPTVDAARDWPRVEQVLGAVGAVRRVKDEEQMHAVAAVAASGPAWLLLAVEALIDGGVEAGLPRAEALAYAAGALKAAAARLDDDVEPVSVRGAITSPAGTTAAGLAALEARGTRAAFIDAVRAAAARSRTLG